MRNFANFVLLILCLFISSCETRLNKIYGYKIDIHNQKNISIFAELEGVYAIKNEVVIKSSPYRLRLRFKSASKIEGTVSIQDIILRDVNSDNIILNKDMMPHYHLHELSWQRFVEVVEASPLYYEAAFTLSDLNLEYFDYVLTIKYLIKSKQLSDKVRELKFNLKKDYQEYKTNILLDAFMSV